MTQLVGIVGAYGAVGAATARFIRTFCAVEVRLGGRDLKRTQRLIDTDLGAGAAMSVDVDDPVALSRFCQDCSVVVNCAGPSHRVQDRVARAALAAGADYVDPGGDEPLHASLAPLDLVRRDRRAILSAGLMPGLSGIIPRWIAQHGFDRADRLTAFISLRTRFTHAAAVDFLLSDHRGYGESLAAWQHGVRVSRALEPLAQIELPYFQTRVDAYPYLSREADRLAAALGLSDLHWYHLFDDQRIVSLVGRLQQEIGEGQPVDAAADALVRAVDVELFGREPSVVLVFELAGLAQGRSLQRTALFRATDTYETSGAVAALAVDAVLAHRMSPGVHYAADVLDAPVVIQRLRECPMVGALELLDHPADRSAAHDEGVL